MNFDLNINVQIGVTPQLATFLTALLQSRPETPATLAALEVPAPEPVESEQPQRTRQAETAAPEVENPEPEAPSAPEPIEETPAAPVVETAKKSSKTPGERIREIMHLTRQRIEGEDYKVNTDGEAYQLYHKPLTNQFKQIAAILGYEKPSLIDDPEKIEAFAAHCEALIIGDDGNITAPEAPY